MGEGTQFYINTCFDFLATQRFIFKFYALSFMSSWVYFFIYLRGLNRYCFSKFFFRHCASGYLLCCGSFSLCAKNGGRICTFSRVCKLISFNNRVNNKSNHVKGSIFSCIYWGELNIFPYAFFRVSRYTPTLFRLS